MYFGILVPAIFVEFMISATSQVYVGWTSASRANHEVSGACHKNYRIIFWIASTKSGMLHFPNPKDWITQQCHSKVLNVHTTQEVRLVGILESWNLSTSYRSLTWTTAVFQLFLRGGELFARLTACPVRQNSTGRHSNGSNGPIFESLVHWAGRVVILPCQTRKVFWQEFQQPLLFEAHKRDLHTGKAARLIHLGCDAPNSSLFPWLVWSGLWHSAEPSEKQAIPWPHYELLLVPWSLILRASFQSGKLLRLPRLDRKIWRDSQDYIFWTGWL